MMFFKNIRFTLSFGLTALFLLFFNNQVYSNNFIVSAVYYEENDRLPSAATCCCTDSIGFVWVGTQDGLVRFDGYEFKHFKVAPESYKTTISNYIIDIKPLSNSRLALLVQGGQCFVFSTQDFSFRLFPDPQYNVGDDYIFVEAIKVREDSLYLISSVGNSLVIDKDNNSYAKVLRETDIGNDSLTSNKNQIINWRVDNGSLIKQTALLDNSTLYHTLQTDNHTFYSSAEDILAIQPVGENLWLSNSSNSLLLKHSDSDNYLYLNKEGLLQKMPCQFDKVTAIKSAANGNIYVGAKGAVYMLSPQTEFSFRIKKVNLRSDVEVRDLLLDSKNHLWIGTNNDGLYLLQPNDSLYSMHNVWRYNYPPRQFSVNCLFEDSKGIIWMGSTDGITIFDSEQQNYADVRFFFYNSETTNLTYSHITDITEDYKGELWFSSFDGGLYHCSSDRFLGEPLELQQFDIEAKQFLAMSPIDDGLCLLSSNSFFKIITQDKTFEEFSIDVVNGALFRDKSVVCNNRGGVFISSTCGYWDVDINAVRKPVSSPNIVFTGLFSQSANLFPNINSLQSIELTKQQNSFEIKFSDLQYITTSKYRFRLRNFDDQFIVSSFPQATFTNVPCGDYIFQVSDENGIVVRELRIVVLPAWYETILAKVVFVILFIAILSFCFAIYLKYYKLRERNRVDAYLSRIKLNFFTDVSHEIRTPLTLITAPIESLIVSPNLNDEEKNLLGVIRANSDRMRVMVNELLDYSRLDSSHFENNIERQPLTPILTRVLALFSSEIKKKEVEFALCDKTDGAECDFDARQIETAMVNLMSNALKFVSVGGRIVVDADFLEETTVISVENSLPKQFNHKENIFRRFISSGNREDSTGLGLSIVRGIMDNHGGKVSVERGEIFRITMSMPRFTSASVLPNASTVSLNTQTKDKSKSILVLEDNRDLRQFLINALSRKFNVFDAQNGVVGLDVLSNHIPDLILSDIIMPEMDGIEFAQAVKEDSQYSHIPIVLLTAKDDIKTKIQSLNIGITDYITKPFSLDYLLTRIDNILKERELLQAKIRGVLIKDDEKVEVEENAELSEAKEITDKILENLADETLDVDSISAMFRLSRTSFTSKCKTLFGLTPVELIRDIRMKRAKELLASTDMTIQEITYAIGFTDQRYFARVFKQTFGITATEFREQ